MAAKRKRMAKMRLPYSPFANGIDKFLSMSKCKYLLLSNSIANSEEYSNYPNGQVEPALLTYKNNA